MTIDRRINEALKGLLDVYPDTADFEDEENTAYPYAVFKARRHGSKTKEGHRAGDYSVGIFLAAKNYNESQELEEKIRSAILGMEDGETNAVFLDSICELDEDGAWVTEMNFEIRTY